jgi:dihydrofolate reductase
MKDAKNTIFIATSIDGRIADRNNNIDWLHDLPNPEGNDMGYNSFIEQVDAIVMGKNTFETVCGFDIEWPYKIPVFVLSNSLKSIDNELTDKVEIISGDLKAVIKSIHTKGHKQLYIDGGATIQGFLAEDLIDEMIITTIPIVLGGGPALFNETPSPIKFNLVNAKVFLKTVVQNHYIRK